MKVVIVEDEIAASDNLSYLLQRIDPRIEILTVLDSVKASVAYFSESHEAELVFMDIHLADGISFDIFDRVVINVPVIFTTAYDQYALKAFKVNSIDYLLKPIDQEELADALRQFKTQLHGNVEMTTQMDRLLSLFKVRSRNYKSTFLVGQRDQLVPLKTESMAYLYIETGVVKLVTHTNQTYFLDKTLEEMEHEMDPDCFYRVNRQFIVSREAIVNIQQYFHGKLIVNVAPPYKVRILVSKAKASDFKEWINN